MPLNVLLYRFFRKIWRTRQIIRFQEEKSGAYIIVREHFFCPQNLYELPVIQIFQKNLENSADRGISSCEKNFSLSNPLKLEERGK